MRGLRVAFLFACTLFLTGRGAPASENLSSNDVENAAEASAPPSQEAVSGERDPSEAAEGPLGDEINSPAASSAEAVAEGKASATISVTMNGNAYSATLEDNESSEAFLKLLEQGSITVQMSDYGQMEKVGELGVSLPTADERITTSPGDIILYQGDKITIYYAPNTWSFTRLGRIQGVSDDELRQMLGSGDATVTFEL